METTLSNRNETILKQARRLIITYYVLKIVLFIGGPIIDILIGTYFLETLQINMQIYDICRRVFVLSITTIVFILAMLKLKQHSNIYLKAITNIFIITTLIGFAQSIFVTDTTVHIIIDCIVAYLSIVAYRHLSREETIKSNHPEVNNLILLTFINTLMSLGGYVLFIITSTSQANDQAYEIIAIHQFINTFTFLITTILMLICWKRLLYTPSDIPEIATYLTMENNELSRKENLKISFIPSRIEIGFIISITIFFIATFSILTIFN